MVRIVIDEALRSRLHDFREDVELCDEQGRIVARVTPAAPAESSDGWVQLTKDYTPEEWLRLSQSTERGISTAELLKLMQRAS